MIPTLLISFMVFSQLAPSWLLTAPLALDFTSSNQPMIQRADIYAPLVYRADPPNKITPSLGIATTAEAVVVLDTGSGRQLFRKNPNQERSIASLTKLMTALVFLDHNPGFNQEVEIVDSDQVGESSIDVLVGDRMTVRDLFYASLANSANNATQALARASGLPLAEFIAAMNDRAKAMGLTRTRFFDVTGLNPGNVSTASELAQIADFALRNSEIAQATLLPDYEFTTFNTKRTIRFSNTDKLLGSGLNLTGGKTGYNEEAGYCLTVRTDDGQGHNVVIVVLGSSGTDERFQETKGLISWTFENWRWSAAD